MALLDIHFNRILILDFGSQYTQLIARTVRKIGVYCEIHSYDTDPVVLCSFRPHGIILSGSPESTTVRDGPRVPQELFDLQVPLLGICYGMQVMALQLGGLVESSDRREFGYAQVLTYTNSDLLRDIEDQVSAEGYSLLDVWMSHGDQVTILPFGFTRIASTLNCPIAGMSREEKHWYGLQFHPEVSHTHQGELIIRRFVLDICGCEPLWTISNIIEDNIADIRTKVGNDKVLLGLSGGVDSSVVAAILHRAIHNKLICIFVDTGLLRLGEGDQVMSTFDKHLGIKVIRINAGNRFLSALSGITEPEEKRKIIGKLFIKIFEEEAEKLCNIKWLAQGTIYPDVIESAGMATGKAHVIKSHHNVGGLPEAMHMKLIEPLRELFKDEVRQLGVELGLPIEMIYRHPFPGPGLAVRILGEVRKEYITLLQRADHVLIEELHRKNLYNKTSQAFVVFLPVKSVGVMGDERYYDFVIALRAVETVDFMTAKWVHLPYEFLDLVSRRIINEIPGISRVVYDISSKPPATIEWE